MSARNKARKRALDILFEADQRRLSPADVLESRIAIPGTETPLSEYSIAIVTGVIENQAEIDRRITESLEDWSLERLPAVDRAILRVAAWEILHNPEVETAIAIDEAVTLAADLSTEASPSFINGILGTIARAHAQAPAKESDDPVE